MKGFLHKPYRWAIIYSVILTLITTYVLLDTFVITKAIAAVPESSSQSAINITENDSSGTGVESTQQDQNSGEDAAETESTPVITDTSYEDDNISITIETRYVYDTWVYIADIQISDVSYLKTAFAEDTYGRNIKDTTSDIAEENDAIFAINGDYYGFRDYGFVLRNGVLYRSTASDEGDDEALVIDSDGNFSIINENDTDAAALEEAGVWQVLSFGPALINGGEICVDSDTEVDKSKSSNPRTAIGQMSELHYIVIVSDGRTDDSEGLTLLELAELFDEYGCSVAYNLDGGGSATMWFNGEVVNNPVGGKSSSSERRISDIVYFS